MQQLLNNTQDNLFLQFQDMLFEEAENLITYDKFRVGCNSDKWQYVLDYYKLLKNDNCEISGYIKEKIYGSNCKKPVHAAIKDYKHKHNCSDEQTIKQCCPISNIGIEEF